MIKLGRGVLSALALGALVSQTASATTICETTVPKSAFNDNGRSNVQKITICAATNGGKATGFITKGSDAPETYQLVANYISGAAGGSARLLIADAEAGNVVPNCTVTDNSANNVQTLAASCTANVPGHPQLFMYLIVN